MSVHRLKTWSEPFAAIWDGSKTAEFRLDDRTPRYEVQDILVLYEWEAGLSNGRELSVGATGREIMAEATHIVRGPAFGIPAGYCMMSLRVCGKYTKPPVRPLMGSDKSRRKEFRKTTVGRARSLSRLCAENPEV